MKPAKTLAIGAGIVILLLAATFIDRHVALQATPPPYTNPDQGFALLELFTSEGCSSCPAADKLFTHIRETAGDKPIYVLAYHIDYWDHLGWKDIFSNPEFSKRQRQYGTWFGTDQIYTPQVVINGSAECVGSDEAKLSDRITQALNTRVTHSLTLQAKLQGQKILIDYQAEGQINDNHLLIAIVQKHAIRKIQRGENGGRTLEHTSIVRDLQILNVESRGSHELLLPDGFNLQDWELMGLLQQAKNGKVTAAARAVFQ
jgi:hypothetical protein